MISAQLANARVLQDSIDDRSRAYIDCLTRSALLAEDGAHSVAELIEKVAPECELQAHAVYRTGSFRRFKAAIPTEPEERKRYDARILRQQNGIAFLKKFAGLRISYCREAPTCPWTPTVKP